MGWNLKTKGRASALGAAVALILATWVIERLLDATVADQQARDIAVAVIAVMVMAAICFVIVRAFVVAPAPPSAPGAASELDPSPLPATSPSAESTTPDSWVKPEALGDYLKGINDTMDEHGFCREGPGVASSQSKSSEPALAPIPYQVTALTAVLDELAEHGLTSVTEERLEQAVAATPRENTDPRYEPLTLSTLSLGLDALRGRGVVSSRYDPNDFYTLYYDISPSYDDMTEEPF